MVGPKVVNAEMLNSIWKAGGIVLAILVVAVLILMFLHKKTITSGEFAGLRIGETKSQVFSRLQEMANVTSITTEEAVRLSLGRKDISRLNQLQFAEGFNVYGPGVQVVFFLDNGVISGMVGATGSEAFGDIQVGSDFEYLEQEIEKFLNGGDGRGVISRPVGFGPDRTEVWVDAKSTTQSSDDDAYNWLMSRDIWIFNNDNRYTNYRLYFEGGGLKKIIFRNYFIELP